VVCHSKRINRENDLFAINCFISGGRLNQQRLIFFFPFVAYTNTVNCIADSQPFVFFFTTAAASTEKLFDTAPCVTTNVAATNSSSVDLCEIANFAIFTYAEVVAELEDKLCLVWFLFERQILFFATYSEQVVTIDNHIPNVEIVLS
jgi:hypothetical protein